MSLDSGCDYLLRSESNWHSVRTQIETEKECVLWCWTSQTYDLLKVWLPIIIYTPYTPVALKCRLKKILEVDNLVLLPKSLIDHEPKVVYNLVNKGYGIVCCSAKSPNILER